MFSISCSHMNLVVAAALASCASTGLVSGVAAVGRFESTRGTESHSLVTFRQTVGGQRGVDTVFVLPGSHLDVGYTDTPSRVREVRIEVIEDAIQAAQKDPNFIWFEEGGWAFDAWLQRYGQDEKRLATVRQLLKSGQLGVGATWLSPHAAAIPEAVGLLMVHWADLDSLFNYRPSVAVLNDPPSYPEILADALVARDIRYLLVGANMFVSRPLPSQLVRSPFWWQLASGGRLLVYIDPDGFTAGFAKWGLGPRCARFFDDRRFPSSRGDLETMEEGIRAGIRDTPATYHAVIVQQALDNWSINCALELPASVRAWNDSGKLPKLVIAQPEAYFKHIEERYGRELPVYRGEWGGQWDNTRAINPVWTWRLREAARSLRADAEREARAALATALDHNHALGAGRVWETEQVCRAHARGVAEIFSRAVRLAGGSGMLVSEPPAPAFDGPEVPAVVQALLAPDRAVRMRAGPPRIAPFIPANAPELAVPVHVGTRNGRLAVRARLDRRNIADGRVVIEVPLRGSVADFRLAPEESPDAIAGRWLAGEPPFVIAPQGLRVIGTGFSLTVTSPVVFTWMLTADQLDPNVTWLQGLVVWQSTTCTLESGRRVPLPFEVLNPGEPSQLTVQVEIEILG